MSRPAFQPSAFGPRPWAWLLGQGASRAQRRAGVAALLVATALLAAVAWQDHQLREEVARVQLARGATQPTARPAALVLPTVPERQRANRAVRQLNTPWPTLFAMLESQTAPDVVAVLSVEPNIERGAVRIQTEGPALDELLGHASRLAQQPPVRQMQLIRVDEREDQGRRLARLTFELVLAR